MEADEVAPPSDFGTLLRDFRRAAGLTQEALAELAGLSARGVSDLERGLHRAPQRETLSRLARALGLDTAARQRLYELALPRTNTRRHSVTAEAAPNTSDQALMPVAGRDTLDTAPP